MVQIVSFFILKQALLTPKSKISEILQMGLLKVKNKRYFTIRKFMI